MMCRSGSVRSFGIKRVCSIASADGIDSHCMPQQGSIMIPVPGSSNSLAVAASGASPGAAAAAAPALAKRSSKTGSSTSSQEHNGCQALAAAAAAAGQEEASAGDAVCSAGRKLAPIKTSAAPRGPRMRLNGRLLSPEEAQKHLQAVAAAATAASAGRSMSRAQSPAVTCPGGMTSPAGPHGSSMSLSTGAPCNSAGHSSGTSGPAACKPSAHTRDTAATAGAFNSQPGTAAPMRSSRVLSALDVLPENFIPTPEGVGTWHTLASTLEDGCGATSRGCSSPLVCSSYTELLLAEEAEVALPPVAGLRMQDSSLSASFTARAGAGAGSGLPPAAAPRRVSAFAGHSSEPWPPQQQQSAGGASLLASAGSANQTTAGFVSLSSSCPVHIPMHSSSSSSGWTSSKLLGGSITGSNGSSGNNPLASSLAPQGSSAATDAQLSGLLDTWGACQQHNSACAPPQQPLQGLVAFTAGPSNTVPATNSTAAAPAWKPAFSPAGSSAPAPGSSSGMVPTPGMPAAGSTPVLQPQPQQPRAQLSRTKSTASRPKKHSKAAAAKGAAKPSLQLQVPVQQQQSASQQQQQMLMVANASQPVVLSQQELMAVLQQNMAASFASGYMMATSNMNGQGGQQVPSKLQQQQPPLLKPVASIGAFVMPPSAVVGAGDVGPAPWPASTPAGAPAGEPAGGAPCPPGSATTAAAAAALSSSSDMARLVGGHAVDDILPSLQELLTDCY